jgi:hypothetical protein
MIDALRRKAAMLGVLALLVASTLTVVAPPAPALAAASSSAIVYTNGTRAGESFFNRSNGTHSNKAWFDVYDAKCDASSVYVEYEINAGDRQHKENEGGCGTTKGFNLQTGYFAIVYRTCVNDSFGNHPCSGWRADHN